MKKIKLLTPLLCTGTLFFVLTPLVSCNKTEPQPEQIVITIDTNGKGLADVSEYSVDKGSLWGDIKDDISKKVHPIEDKYILGSWKIGLNDIPDHYVINENFTATAHFREKVLLTLSLLGSTGGTVSRNTIPTYEGTQYKDGIKLSLDNYAEPYDNYEFDYWTNQDGDKLSEGYIFNKNETLTAHFRLN